MAKSSFNPVTSITYKSPVRLPDFGEDPAVDDCLEVGGCTVTRATQDFTAVIKATRCAGVVFVLHRHYSPSTPTRPSQPHFVVIP